MVKKNTGEIVINILMVLVAVVYGYFLIRMTLLKGICLGDVIYVETRGVRAINLDPFIGFNKGNPFTSQVVKGHLKAELYANLILFIPFGMILKIFIRGKKAFLKTMAWAFLASLFIELIQYILALGITDIDDIILNTAGGIIGALIVVLMEKISSYETAKRVVAIAGGVIGGLMIFMIFLYGKLPF